MSPSFAAEDRFTDLPISAPTKRALADPKVFGYERLSKPQAQYMSTALSGKDVFVKARTGSGKTLGFMIPLVEAVLRYNGAFPVKAIVISPSRELAAQTLNETLKLLTYHSAAYCAQMVTGGTKVGAERARLTSRPCDILVATPGRLQDHLENLPGFVDALQGVGVVVLDEADRLLDMGFQPAIRRILGALKAPRQTLLFTATVPDGVRQIAAAFMRKDHVFVDTVGKEENSHRKIAQEFLVLPPSSMLAALHRVLATAAEGSNKTIVFFNTAWMAAFAAALFRLAGMTDVMETHSRLSQPQRNAVASRFAACRAGLLFASDVIARGIDFPDVTLVVQFGLTDASQYEHRVGRTGRAGKTGMGLLVLGEDERAMLKTLGSLPIGPAIGPSSKMAAGLQQGARVEADGALARACASVATDANLRRSANRAFSATLGFYASKQRLLGWTPQGMADGVKARFASMGLARPDPIPAGRLAKMHLKGVVGL